MFRAGNSGFNVDSGFKISGDGKGHHPTLAVQEILECFLEFAVQEILEFFLEFAVQEILEFRRFAKKKVGF